MRVLAAALNPLDYKLPEVPLLGRLVTGVPATPGMDFAGRVVAVGPSTSSSSSSRDELKAGQLIFGRLDLPGKFGTLAEFTLAPRAGCVPLPPGVKVEDAAGVASTSLTAYQSIVSKLPPTPDNDSGKQRRVFINGGSGGAGTFGIQVAKAVGCHVTTSCSGANVELCKSLGADVVIDYREKDVVGELVRIARQERFDLVVDNVGLPSELYWSAGDFLAPGARYVQVGSPGPIGFGFLWESAKKMVWPGWLGGGKRPWEFFGLDSKGEGLKRIAEWMGEGKVKGVVDEVFGMEDKGPVKAFEKLRTGRTRGKIVVKIGNDKE